MSGLSKITVLSAALLLAACNSSAPTAELDTLADAAAESSASSEAMVMEDSITFEGRSNIVNHPGYFETFTAELTRDATTPDDLTKASLMVTIDMNSAKSDPGMEGHLKKADFFDVEQFPEATFKTTSITAGTDAGTYVLNGDMTVKGVTKQVAINATVDGNMLTATYAMPRKDFGVGNDSYGNKFLEAMVPVTITLHLE